MVSICKSVKDKYFIMHILQQGVPRNGAAAPENRPHDNGPSGAPNLKVIR